MYLYRTAVRIVDGYNATPASPLFTAKVFRTTPPGDKFDAIDVEFYVGDNLYFARTFAVAEGDDLFFLRVEILDYLLECEADALPKAEHLARVAC
jgi:hypothetical protein